MSAGALDGAERRAWLRLARTQHVGPATFAELIRRFGSAATALAEVPRLARRGGADNFAVPREADIDREIERLTKFGGRFVYSCDADFPSGLAALDAPPPVISVAGRSELLARDMIAMVGARNASALGRKFAGQLAGELGRAGLVIASGMARGIDTAAHEGALATGTCAVVAGGIDVVYPPENASLYARIRHDGVIVAEMPFGQTPQARHFPRRNRIISGLARGVVVVEAAEGSGSLITANFALEQGREVFAMPGSPLDPRAKGTNRLIRDGAVLTETADDVVGVIAAQRTGFRDPGGTTHGGLFDEEEVDGIRARLEELLGPAPVEIDELIRQIGADAALVLAALLELELAGRLERHPGGKVSGA
ncbi:MAG TPA: DNA-processing protein DprA [Rhizomicrobium sp.]|nr:DNA-processing protein DprA [Rhizomicrobium sp.]